MNVCEQELSLLPAEACRAARKRMAQRRAGMPSPATEGSARQTAAVAVKVERRRQIDPTTCERDYSADELEFMRAMDDYKRRSGRPFPTWSEVLEVVRSLGYCRAVVTSLD